MSLTEEQQNVVDSIQKGKNIFLTAPAGYGKSYVIQHIIQYANKNNMNIGITAMTGSAALLLEGQTLHSFLGIGLGEGTAEELFKRNFKNKKLISKLQRLQLLIIDEISMMNAELLDKISIYLGLIRKNNNPFGELQLVLSGDMVQLPPIKGTYCFLSNEWKRANIQIVVLNKNMRQQNDHIFQLLLESVRWGKCSKNELNILESLKNTEFQNGILPTRLYSRNIDVDRINQAELNTLIKESNIKSYEFKVIFPKDAKKEQLAKQLIISFGIPESLNLCIGAQVVLTRNMDRELGLVNGSRGVIHSLDQNKIVVKFNNITYPIEYIEYNKMEKDENITYFSYIPLKLAYALSIHRCQGMTLDAIEIDLGESIFCNGQAYTALSRAKNLNSIRIIDVSSRSFKTSPEVIDFYKNNA